MPLMIDYNSSQVNHHTPCHRKPAFHISSPTDTHCDFFQPDSHLMVKTHWCRQTQKGAMQTDLKYIKEAKNRVLSLDYREKKGGGSSYDLKAFMRNFPCCHSGGGCIIWTSTKERQSRLIAHSFPYTLYLAARLQFVADKRLRQGLQMFTRMHYSDAIRM